MSAYTYILNECKLTEEWEHCPGGMPTFTITKNNIKLIIDYTRFISCELEVDDYKNDFLVPITIYNNDKKIGEVYRKINNGAPYHDEDIMEMLARYTDIDDMKEVFRKMDECFE